MFRRSHDLRYTLKDKSTGEVFFVVVLTLIHKDELEKEKADEAKDEEKPASKDEPVTSDDDVD